MLPKLGAFFSPLVLIFSIFLLQESVLGQSLEEKSFLKIKNFFSLLFPQSFVVEITSSAIQKDIQSIPKIYIKDTATPPVLMLYFSQILGMKVFLTNVAKGISKQYNAISSSLKSFYPFIRSKNYEDFQKFFLIIPVDENTIVVQEKKDSKDLFYTITIDSMGKILSIEQVVHKRSQGKAFFTYQERDGVYLIHQLKAIQTKPSSKSYIFSFKNYDLFPDLKKEDFLG